MIVNVYEDEMTDRVELVKVCDGIEIIGVRFYLAGAADSAAVTFWGGAKLIAALDSASMLLWRHAKRPKDFSLSDYRAHEAVSPV